MNEVFKSVYLFLKWLSDITGLTYVEINIIVYFILIPSLFLFLISKIIRKKYPIIVFLGLVFVLIILVDDFEKFSKEVFDKSVVFLNWFKIVGLNYVQASVVICVILPILILLTLNYFNRKINHSKT